MGEIGAVVRSKDRRIGKIALCEYCITAFDSYKHQGVWARFCSRSCGNSRRKELGLTGRKLGPKKPELVALATQLRTEQGLSYSAIAAKVGAGSNTVAKWLEGVPAPVKTKSSPRKSVERGSPSFLHALTLDEELTKDRKSKIAEAAVLLRLAVRGLRTFRPVFEGDKADWLVLTPAGKALKIQVKWCGRDSKGLPYCRTTRLVRSKLGNKTEPYSEGDYDILVGYDLFLDKCYVWKWEEIKANKAAVSPTLSSTEAWSKLFES